MKGYIHSFHMRYSRLISIHRLQRKINFGPLRFSSLVQVNENENMIPRYQLWKYRHFSRLINYGKGCNLGARVQVRLMRILPNCHFLPSPSALCIHIRLEDWLFMECKVLEKFRWHMSISNFESGHNLLYQILEGQLGIQQFECDTKRFLSRCSLWAWGCDKKSQGWSHKPN